MIEKMVTELRGTTKRNQKIEILKLAFATDPELKKVIARCYNPFEKYYVVKVKATKVGTELIGDNYSLLHKVLDQISTRQVTGNMAKELVVRYMNRLSFDSQKVFLNILTKDLKCGIGPESINAACPGLIEQFSIQLANKWSADKTYPVDYFWGSRKYDGIRCIYQEKRPGVIYTREGNELIGFEHIEADIETLIDRMKEDPVFANVAPEELFVDGELFSDSIGFNEIQGIVLSKTNVDIRKKRQVHLKLFAIGPVNDTYDMVRFFEIRDIFRGLVSIDPIEYLKVNNDPQEIMDYTRRFVDEGFEGLMLRHPHIPYEWRRSNALLKSKLINETVASLTIIGYKPGKEGTKYENTLGAFTCVGTVVDPIFTDGKVKKGIFDVTCDVGSGFSDEERKEIWQDPEAYIGKEIIINYQCMSQNSADESYSLRFGVKKKGFKLDRTNEW